MQIQHYLFRNYNYNYNKSNKASTPQITHTQQNVSNKYASMYAPYYKHNLNFGALNWNEINKYTETLGKRIHSKRHLAEYSEQYKDAKGITAGSGIPQIWTDRIADKDKFDKDNFIEDFGKIFAEERKYSDIDKLENKLSKLFQEHKIIDDKTPLSVKYIGEGFQAWAYKISIGTDENQGIVTKLFKHHKNILQNHGNTTEQNLAEYVKAYAHDNSEFVKYHYGDTKNGIMLVDYIPHNIDEPKKILDLTDIGIGYGDDFPKNRINGHICDYGGIETVSNLIGNKAAQEVHSAIKYAKTDEEKIKIFNDIYEQRDNSDEFKDKAIGLVHSIKHMPEEMQADLFKKCYDLKSHRVNIALIQNIKKFSKFPEMKGMINDLVLNSTDQKEQETVAKEIKHIPDIPRHKFFEQQTNTKVSAIIKYLSRNINQYYKDLPNRVNIYNTFIENCDTYSGMALINSMKYMGSKHYDTYFEKFYNKKDTAINTTLARSLELLREDSNIQKKWINKLIECDNNDVNAGLAESISFVNDENREELFTHLLTSKDKVTKEFLAQNITSVPSFANHSEWVDQLLDGADNMVRGTLVNTTKSIKQNNLKEKWLKLISEGSDKTIKTMCKN